MLEATSRSIYIPARGVRVELPPQVLAQSKMHEHNIHRCSQTCERPAIVPLSWESKYWIIAIQNDRTLRRRYPQEEIGQRFMTQVDHDWRETLYDRALDLTGSIQNAAREIGVQRFAVVLYGSVARNLVKRPGHPDPSNIDIAVVGSISCQEKDEMYRLIRNDREEVTTRIKDEEKNAIEARTEGLALDRVTKAKLGRIDREIDPIGRAGVIIRSVPAVKESDYDLVLWYMAGCGQPLYDHDGLWAQLEHEAMPHLALSTLSKHQVKGIKRGFEFIDGEEQLDPRFLGVVRQIYPVRQRALFPVQTSVPEASFRAGLVLAQT